MNLIDALKTGFQNLLQTVDSWNPPLIPPEEQEKRRRLLAEIEADRKRLEEAPIEVLSVHPRRQHADAETAEVEATGRWAARFVEPRKSFFATPADDSQPSIN